jgi:hypothetical protein
METVEKNFFYRMIFMLLLLRFLFILHRRDY